MHHLTFKGAEKYNPWVRIERQGEMKGTWGRKHLLFRSLLGVSYQMRVKSSGGVSSCWVSACGDASLLDGDAPEKTIKVEVNRA